MSQHPFLSDAWIEAARALHEAHRDGFDPPEGAPVRMNLVIEHVPFATGTLEAHLDTSSGMFEIDLGHLASADVRVTLGYETAQAVLVDGDGQAAMQAFLGGQIQVEGNLAVLLAAFSGHQSSMPPGLSSELRAITAPIPAR